MKNRSIKHSDNWATPEKLYQELNDEFGFDFDPCPLNLNEITPETDGLLSDWGKRNFVNPPYSRRLKEQFIKKAILEATKGKLCVLLIPVSTSTAIFHDYILPNASEIRFLRGRVRFVGVNTKGEFVDNKPPMHDSMIVVFGDKDTN